MKGFLPVFRKELHAIFASPIFYVVAFIFLVISGIFYYVILSYFNSLSFELARNPALARQLNITEVAVRSFFLNLSFILIFIAPLLTMRLYAEERKSGTLELLFTYPITDAAAVAGKFAASVAAFVVLLVGTLPGIVAFAMAATPAWKPILSGYLGVFLMGCSFLSLGLFSSSLTQNQIIAAVIAFGITLVLWFIGEAKTITGSMAVGGVLEYLSVTKHFEGLAKGVLDSRDVLFFCAFSIFFLFLTLRQMSSYRWRG
ncbi:MAG: ABC transporter permease subunit [Desulfobacteraceae bacterium]|nr:ABC transporter permease subunit [Desulfobacteraceae bacterium]